MPRINILDIETSNKIAAGEVVERPASVVKELLENSIDAGSKKLLIEIQNGGESLIKIMDDGYGIHPDDIDKAFLPHATSKIKNIEDIYSINTLGFRGEALPSIASVAKVKLITRTEENNFGRELSIIGGAIDYIKDTGSNIGTTIEVKDLFYNVPARKKFMKSTSRESALINDIVSRVALANPDISFQLLNNDKKVFSTYGNNNLKDVIRAVYGKNFEDNLIYFEGHNDILSVHGYIGNEELSRGSRNNQSIFVNKRYIKNKTITAAVENAFKSFLTINKFPFFTLFIDIFPDYVDVNIHPTKSEIKFKDERLVFKLVFDSVHNAIRQSLTNDFLGDVESSNEPIDTLEYIRLEAPSTVNEHYISDNSNVKEETYDALNITHNISCKDAAVNYSSRPYINNEKSLFNNEEKELNEETYTIENPTLNNSTIESTAVVPSAVNVPMSLKSLTAKLPPIKVIGQFNKTYILGEYDNTLYLIDQHAAHEKILFEKYMHEIATGDVVVQTLMIPVVLELSFEDYGYFEENREVFKHCGFIIEDFGDNTINIKEVPYLIGKLEAKRLFFDILDNIKNLGSGKKEEIKYEKIASMACRSAIKANDNLSLKEIESLLDELKYIEDPYNCPHGRPTIIKMSLYELEKKFKRIQ